ncbi:hypothetical protein YQE_05194, partial [Dendroctonus ponderosae]
MAADQVDNSENGGVCPAKKQKHDKDATESVHNHLKDLSEKSYLEKVFHNDAYGNYTCFPVPELNSEFLNKHMYHKS